MPVASSIGFSSCRWMFSIKASSRSFSSDTSLIVTGIFRSPARCAARQRRLAGDYLISGTRPFEPRSAERSRLPRSTGLVHPVPVRQIASLAARGLARSDRYRSRLTRSTVGAVVSSPSKALKPRPRACLAMIQYLLCEFLIALQPRAISDRKATPAFRSLGPQQA